MRVVRIYHAGRDAAHRERDRRLAALGVELTLVVPAKWGGVGGGNVITDEPFDVVELDVVRPGDVNRHRYSDTERLRQVLVAAKPDLVDVHEEPYSAVTRQVLSVVPADVPVVSYTAQNLDKRYPPPYTWWERAAYARLTGLYPCSRQAGAVARRRGFTGLISVLPLGYDPTLFTAGSQDHTRDTFTMSLVSRLIPEKGVRDAIAVLAAVRQVRPARLVLAGDGPEAARVPSYCREFGLEPEDIDRRPWVEASEVARIYQHSHLALAPSRATNRIAEQYGRMIPEAQACGAVVMGYVCGAIPEVAGGAAWLSAEGDLRGLTRAAADLAQNESAWGSLRTAGFEQAAAKTWDVVTAGQAAFYERAIDMGARSAGVDVRRVALSGSQEFGTPARAAGHVERPFALPVLRDLPWLARRLELDRSRTVSRS